MKERLHCLFCQIINGSTASFPIFEDEHTFAFLDHKPLFPGHCLLVPKAHFNTLSDLPLQHLEHYFANVQLLSNAVQETMHAEGSFVAINNIVSQSVPHLHTHIVPRKKGDGLKGFFWPRYKYENEFEMQSVQKQIKQTLERYQSRE